MVDFPAGDLGLLTFTLPQGEGCEVRPWCHDEDDVSHSSDF